MAFTDDAPIHLLKKKSSIRPRTKQQWVKIGRRKIFSRSSWETWYANHLEFLRQNKTIKDWKHEPKEFWFLKIKRGVRSYKPDFLITENDGRKWYAEVKGWMDPRSATKLKRMKKYHPDIEVRVIDKTWFNRFTRSILECTIRS